MNPESFTITGNIVDIFNKSIYEACIDVELGKIKSIIPTGNHSTPTNNYILPGFIDSHVHIESSMLIPSEFAKLAVVHGTVATVSDPHEIANVCGIKGVEFMINNGKKVPFKFYFGAPSCVPATQFETAGAALDAEDVKALLEKDEIKYLSEMMNFPGVLNKDPEVMQKLRYAHALGKPIDGHAPSLRGDMARNYIEAGISTDHECFTIDEALDKLIHGMKIIIREGSAAKNFDALVELLEDYPTRILFCSDDKHPDSLANGHINQLCARAVAKGLDIFYVLRAACVNPVVHYKLDVGLLFEGDDADFIVTDSLTDFNIKKTFIKGKLVAENGISLIKSVDEKPINQFKCEKIKSSDLLIPIGSFPVIDGKIALIEALDGQLITNKVWESVNIIENNYCSNIDNDQLKMVVVNRYHPAPIAKCFIKNFGLKQGAIASSVAHDSHNIVAVGVDDESLAKAINLVIEKEGGVGCVSETHELVLALPVAGLMSTDDGYQVSAAYTAIDKMAKELGSKLQAPFMTLSFMALLVIPHLKLSDKGLFDGDEFKLVSK